MSLSISFRPSTDTDLDAALAFLQRDVASSLTAAGYRAGLDAGEYRLDWTWLAVDEESGEALAVAVWWGGRDEDGPAALDAFHVHESVGTGEPRVALAAALIRAGHDHFAGHALNATAQTPAYHVFIPADWRERPDVVAALGWRQEAAIRAGLSDLLERLRYEWSPADGLPEASGRLTFRAEPDDQVFVALFERVLEGSLDTTSTTEAAAVGAKRQAAEDLELYRTRLLGDRSWWRVACDESGDVIGFGIPSRNAKFPCVGYLGVLPEQRGRGYADDILAEITRILVQELRAQAVRADTDLVNRPMAASFERVGYRNFARRLVYSAPAGAPAGA